MLLLPVTHTLGAHGASIGPADVLLGLGEPHQNLRSNSPDLNRQKRTTMRPQKATCTDLEELTTPQAGRSYPKCVQMQQGN